MVNVRVRLYAGLREFAGASEVEVNIQGKKVGLLSLLRRLCEMFGKPFSNNFFDEKGEYKGFFVITVNGVDMRRLKGLETQISSGDSIGIIPPAAGG